MKQLFKSVYEYDAKYLKHRRNKLRKEQNSIRKTRKKIAKQARNLEEKEEIFREKVKDYEGLVQSVTRKFQFNDPETVQKRQEMLQEALITRTIQRPEPIIEFER